MAIGKYKQRIYDLAGARTGDRTCLDHSHLSRQSANHSTTGPIELDTRTRGGEYSSN